MRLIGEQFSEGCSGMIPEGGFEIIGVWRDTDGHFGRGKEVDESQVDGTDGGREGRAFFRDLIPRFCRIVGESAMKVESDGCFGRIGNERREYK